MLSILTPHLNTMWIIYSLYMNHFRVTINLDRMLFMSTLPDFIDKYRIRTTVDVEIVNTITEPKRFRKVPLLAMAQRKLVQHTMAPLEALPVRALDGHTFLCQLPSCL